MTVHWNRVSLIQNFSVLFVGILCPVISQLQHTWPQSWLELPILSPWLQLGVQSTHFILHEKEKLACFSQHITPVWFLGLLRTERKICQVRHCIFVPPYWWIITPFDHRMAKEHHSSWLTEQDFVGLHMCHFQAEGKRWCKKRFPLHPPSVPWCLERCQYDRLRGAVKCQPDPNQCEVISWGMYICPGN